MAFSIYTTKTKGLCWMSNPPRSSIKSRPSVPSSTLTPLRFRVYICASISICLYSLGFRVCGSLLIGVTFISWFIIPEGRVNGSVNQLRFPSQIHQKKQLRIFRMVVDCCLVLGRSRDIVLQITVGVFVF